MFKGQSKAYLVDKMRGSEKVGDRTHFQVCRSYTKYDISLFSKRNFFQYIHNYILIVLLMQFREIKVKKGSHLTIIVDEEGDLIPQVGSQFSYIQIKSWSNPLSPIRRTYDDFQDDGKKLQTKSNKTSINSTSCRCKKSKCLKSYCDCFAEGRKCSKQCDCTGCQNTQDHRRECGETKKVSVLEKGCSCEKSNCLKRYCVCHAAGRRCQPSCRCKICKNVESGQDQQEMDENQLPKENKEAQMKLIEYPYPLRQFSVWEHYSSLSPKNESS